VLVTVIMVMIVAALILATRFFSARLFFTSPPQVGENDLRHRPEDQHPQDSQRHEAQVDVPT
jgi:hypothetical protein